MTLEIEPVTAREGQTGLQRTELRLAFLTNLIPPYWKCIFESLFRIYPHLRIFVSTRMESNRAWDADWSGLDVILQKSITLRGRWRHPKGFEEPLYIHLPFDTISQLGKFQPDVVISSEMGVRTLMALAYRKLHPHSRLVVWADISESTEHGRGVARRSIRSVVRKNVDAFIVLGESGARYLQSIGVSETKIFPIPYTTDISRFAACPLARSENAARRVLYVGQLSERKGLVPFLSVLSTWAIDHSDRAIELVLVGDGPLRNSLESASFPSNLKLIFRGNIAYAGLPSEYAEAGIFAFPTLADTWGVVVNEALASGLPVLGSIYSQAVNELVEDGINGWHFQPDVSESTYRALDEVMQLSVDQLNRMRQHARATATRITPEFVAELIDKVVTRVTGAI